MSNEYRPRLRATRKNPVSRKGNAVIAVCKDDDDAAAIELLLKDIFAAAKRAEKLDVSVANASFERNGTATPLES